MKKLKLIALFAALLTTAYAQADPYLDWAGEVEKASKGLSVCIDTYASAIQGNRPEKDQPLRLANARRTCEILKIGFDTTMLAVCTRVENMDKPLANYHEAVLQTFEYVVAEPREDPLAYMIRTSATKLGLVQLQNLLIECSAVEERLQQRIR